LYNERRRAVRELVPVVGGARGREIALGELELPRMPDDRIGRDRGPGQRGEQNQLSHWTPPAAAARFVWRVSTFRPSATKYFFAIRWMSSTFTACSFGGSVLIVSQPR